MQLASFHVSLSLDDLVFIYLCRQVRQHLRASSLVFSMWTWTVSLCLWGSVIDQSSKVRLAF